MNIRERKDIRVFNECPSQVNLVGQYREYIFPPCLDGEPTMNFVEFNEIEYAHSRCQVFNLGLLHFDESEQDEIYNALGIKDWRNKVWFNKDIEDCIMNPTAEKMQRIIDVKNISAFERIRGMMVKFVNEKRDVSQNVIKLINARFRELSSGNTNTSIVVKPSDVETKTNSTEVEDLKRQLAEMQKLMEKMAAQTAQVPIEKEEDTPAPAKKAGRKAYAKK